MIVVGELDNYAEEGRREEERIENTSVARREDY